MKTKLSRYLILETIIFYTKFFNIKLLHLKNSTFVMFSDQRLVVFVIEDGPLKKPDTKKPDFQDIVENSK